jgi:hypothetical protein
MRLLGKLDQESISPLTQRVPVDRQPMLLSAPAPQPTTQLLYRIELRRIGRQPDHSDVRQHLQHSLHLRMGMDRPICLAPPTASMLEKRRPTDNNTVVPLHAR